MNRKAAAYWIPWVHDTSATPARGLCGKSGGGTGARQYQQGVNLLFHLQVSGPKDLLASPAAAQKTQKGASRPPRAAAPPASSNNGARSPNDLPRSKAAGHRAIG